MWEISIKRGGDRPAMAESSEQDMNSYDEPVDAVAAIATIAAIPPERGWPPPPHDPRERVSLCHMDGWEVLAFRVGGVKHNYFAPRGMLHLQLWHAHSGVSVLTPSRLTLQRYEAYPIADWKFAHASLRSVRGLVRSTHGVELPVDAAIRALERWHVAPYQRTARPVSAAAAAPSPSTGDVET
jgi:hypothetical protein